MAARKESEGRSRPGGNPGGSSGSREGSAPSSGEEGGSWAQRVAGGTRVFEWSAPMVSTREVEELEAFFSSSLVLPPGDIGEEREKWEGRALIMRSLGRRVPPAWAGRDMRLRLALSKEPEITPIADDHFLVRFEETGDCERAIIEAPWIVGGQLLAFEPWRPAFVPSRWPISKTVVWLRLPGLSMECWRPSSILAIAAEAGRPISLDSFTEKQRKKGFARVKVELDAMRPLRPGVVVEAGEEKFWQQFQFESLPAVCFLCGLLGHFEDDCPCHSPLPGPRMPRLGPWITASRIRQPRVLPSGEVHRAGPDSSRSPSSSGPSSSPPTTMPSSSSSPPGSPPDLEGWQKPSKVARRSKPAQWESSGNGLPRNSGALSMSQSFAPMPDLGDTMELGANVGVEIHMADPDQALLKRPRSPPSAASRGRPASSDPSSSPGTSSIIPTTRVGQVRQPTQPCMSLPVDTVGEAMGSVLAGGVLVVVPIEVDPLLQGRGKGALVVKELGTRVIEPTRDLGVARGQGIGDSGEGYKVGAGVSEPFYRGLEGDKGKQPVLQVDISEAGAAKVLEGGVLSYAGRPVMEGDVRAARGGRGGGEAGQAGWLGVVPGDWMLAGRGLRVISWTAHGLGRHLLLIGRELFVGGRLGCSRVLILLVEELLLSQRGRGRLWHCNLL